MNGCELQRLKKAHVCCTWDRLESGAISSM